MYTTLGLPNAWNYFVIILILQTEVVSLYDNLQDCKNAGGNRSLMLSDGTLKHITDTLDVNSIYAALLQ